MKVEDVELDSSACELKACQWKIEFEEAADRYTLFVRIENPPAVLTEEFWAPICAVKPYLIEVWGPELIKLRVLRKSVAEITKAVKALADRGVDIPPNLRYIGGIT